jgi:RimJ/RimL family protein N-acetyltransferase
MTSIILHPIETLADAELDILVSILNEDQELKKWIGTGKTITRDEFIAIARTWTLEKRTKMYAILTDQPIGTISVSHITPEGSARIGYWITSREWNQGFGTQAFRLALEKAREMGIREVSANIESHNLASVALWAKYGARQEIMENGRIRVRLNILAP